jgi:hypothetical protein
MLLFTYSLMFLFFAQVIYGHILPPKLLGAQHPTQHVYMNYFTIFEYSEI